MTPCSCFCAIHWGQVLTHWGRATHICVSKLTIIASDNGLSPGRRQAITCNNAGILSIGLFGRKISEILIEILTFSFKKMRLKVSSAIWRPFCLDLNVLGREWRYKWNSADRRCSNYIWVINNFIAHYGATYIRMTVVRPSFLYNGIPYTGKTTPF